MNNINTLLSISILLAVILAAIIILGLSVQKASMAHRYIFSKKIKNINWKYIFKVWLTIQVIVLLSETNHIQDNIIVIISSPIIVISVLLSLFLFNFNPNDVGKYIKDKKDLKSFERDEKIKKILK